MSQVGLLKQYKGPFSQNYEINFGANCKISVSVDEDDYMAFGSQFIDDRYKKTKQLIVKINGEDIQIGRTFMYETGETINDARISFPNGAPVSTTVNIAYCEAEV